MHYGVIAVIDNLSEKKYIYVFKNALRKPVCTASLFFPQNRTTQKANVNKNFKRRINMMS
jgi:hypothetical protein